MRQDNADLRLTPRAQAIGMNGLEDRMERVHAKEDGISKITQLLTEMNADPDELNPFLESIGSSPVSQKAKLSLVLSRPHISVESLRKYIPALDSSLSDFDKETISLAEVNIKYKGYIEREQEMVDKMNRLESLNLHDSLDYSKISSLSAESREKLSRLRPRTLGQASRISGVSPSDISVLMVHMGR